MGDQIYDSGQLIAVLSCRCQGPVCDECACEDSPDACRICGCDFLAVEIVSKREIMNERNYYKQWGSSNMEFFVMMHKDCQEVFKRLQNTTKGNLKEIPKWISSEIVSQFFS